MRARAVVRTTVNKDSGEEDSEEASNKDGEEEDSDGRENYLFVILVCLIFVQRRCKWRIRLLKWRDRLNPRRLGLNLNGLDLS